MSINRTKCILFIFIIFLTACAKQAQAVQQTSTSAPQITAFNQPTDIPTDIPSNTDPSLFGVLAKAEIDPMASKIQEAVFIKVMDGFAINGNIIEYQIIATEVFPSSDGSLIAEIYYNVRTTDSSWLVDGGTQSDNNWIKNKCNRFDFVNTEAEFQLKNRRTCN
ncbi:MAG TPA: hypothetical protein DCX53_14740 [Anaerolineae bacterium]|nr:hypothetical protein [Anaerolineae bacterium]